MVERQPNLTVAKDGSSDSYTIAEAIERAPSKRWCIFTIRISARVYDEYVVVSSHKWNITVKRKWFTAEELRIVNMTGPVKGQAVALFVSISYVAFYRCNISAYQDTLYISHGLQFYRHCTIEGTMDFIFGYRSAVFQECKILVRKPNPNQMNILTADGRQNQKEKSWISIENSIIAAAPDRTGSKIGTMRNYSIPDKLGKACSVPKILSRGKKLIKILDVLQQWVATELRQKEPHDLTSVMVIVERLEDFKQGERPRSPRHERAKYGGDSRSLA
ncbi:hypothetical protein RJ640_013704 [Escallonia rubra]|uniref:Pectinesterase catalytic domain-containing protein n=1 Tax=Escallonia rubra TaxID=112253 RepID=A0AA88QA34_9ASTE|nr:hypothetical protein RJ640_013704 [Escallonia rubra]